MFKRVFQLFKIARKLASSGAIDTINEIYSIPLPVKFFFEIVRLFLFVPIENKSKKILIENGIL